MGKKPKPGGLGRGDKGGSRSLRRKHGFATQRRTLLVVCEGTTERRLLDDLRAEWRLSSLKVVAVGGVGTPGQVVHRASKERSDYDEVWAAFDRDEHTCWGEALERAKRESILLAVSNPCFELWALLLFEDQNGHIERDVAQRKLSQRMAGYDHSKSPFLALREIRSQFAVASRRAKTLNERAGRDGLLYPNPSTTFHELIDRLLREIPV